MSLRFPLEKPGEDPQTNREPSYGANCFIVELLWDSGHDLDAFALLGRNQDGRARVFERGHVLSCHNVGAESQLVPHSDGSFSTPCGTITHSGDVRSGEEKSVDETITIRCEQCPQGINEILVFVAVHQKEDQGHKTFEGVKKSRVRVRNEQGDELGFFRLSRFRRDSCVHVASILLTSAGWECVLLGEGFKGNLNSILARLSPTGPTSIAARHVIAMLPEETGAQSPSGELIVSQGVPVTVEDLRQGNQSASEKTLLRACGLLRTFNPDTATLDSCLTWGTEVSKAYARVIRRWTKLSEDNTLTETRGYILRLQEALSSVDFSVLRGIGREGLLSRITGSAEATRNQVLNSFSEKKKEIDRIVGVVRKRKRALLNMRERVNAIKDELHQLGEEVRVFVIAGAYLSAFLRQKGDDNSRYEELADVLERRCDELVRIEAELVSSSGITELSIQQTLNCVQIAEAVILVSVPAWLSNFMALHVVLKRNEALAPVDIDRVAHGLTTISGSLRL